jgi:osmotically-inducible protein OsmY
MTKLVAAFGLLTVLVVAGLAQDADEAAPRISPTDTSGHTIAGLRQGIRQEARRVGEKFDEVGREIDDELGHVRREVAKKFEAMQTEVHKMPTYHRVYSRIHWDKSLCDAKIEVHMLRDGIVLLRGTVPTEDARKHAVELARECVGVTSVLNGLTMQSAVTRTQTGRAPR